MLYVVTYEIRGICRPGGGVFGSREEALAFAKSMTETALDQLGDAVPLGEWFAPDGKEIVPCEALASESEDAIADMIGQISDTLKADGSGHVDILEYDDITQLLAAHNVASWCSKDLRVRINEFRRAHDKLLADLKTEWASI